MRVLITGVLGCIGTYVARDLIRTGAEVVGYDVVDNRQVPHMVLTPEEEQAVHFVRGDITDLAHLLRTVKEERITHIVHMAALLIPDCDANPPLALKVNAEGTVHVLEAARLLEIPRLVWASSAAVFGPPDRYAPGLLPNDAPHYPTTTYGACKSVSERYAEFYAQAYGVDSIGLRFTVVYGVGRMRGRTSFTTKMIEAAATGRPYRVPFGDATVDWQYVEDVSALVVRALTAPTPRTKVFTASGQVRPVQEGVDYLTHLVPEAQLRVEPGTMPLRRGYDISALQNEIGLPQVTPMEEGIRLTLERFRQLQAEGRLASSLE